MHATLLAGLPSNFVECEGTKDTNPMVPTNSMHVIHVYAVLVFQRSRLAYFCFFKERQKVVWICVSSRYFLHQRLLRTFAVELSLKHYFMLSAWVNSFGQSYLLSRKIYGIFACRFSRRVVFHTENYQCVKINRASYELFTLKEIKSSHR